MFNQYDLIRWESQGYNVRLENLFVTYSLDVKPTIAEQAGLLLGRLLGGTKLNSRLANRDTAYLGHGAVSR